MEHGIVIQIIFGLVVLIFTLFLTAYFSLKKKYKYWKMKGVPGPTPSMIFGNFKDLFFSKVTEAELINEVCRQFKNEKYIGLYYMWTPVLLVKDLNLVKKIVETDFEHFVDHPEITGETEADSVVYSLFMMKGRIWKERRLFFSKLFTPKKLKEYFHDMDAGLNILLRDISKCAAGSIDIELISFLEKYTVQSIVSSMYGLDLISNDKTTSKFAALANKIIHPSLMSVAKIVLHTAVPSLCNLFKISSQPREIWVYFSRLVRDLFETRECSKLDRIDLVSLLMKLMKEGSADIKKIDFKEAVGHFFTFFQAGHHTTEVTLSHVLLRLAQNPDVQENVKNEIVSAMKDSEVITYDSLKNTPYLDSVISETLRIYPVLGVMKRICTKEYTLDERLRIPKNVAIYIPVNYLHNDPEYFEEPQEFRPERFSGEYEAAAYMPFGKGPRFCIGMKFAELEMKKAIASIICKYQILPSERMKLPMVFDPKTLFFTNIPIDGIWIKFEHRNTSN